MKSVQFCAGMLRWRRRPRLLLPLQSCFVRVQEGKLQAWVDESHGFKGVAQIPDAIEYMLQGHRLRSLLSAVAASKGLRQRRSHMWVRLKAGKLAG